MRFETAMRRMSLQSTGDIGAEFQLKCAECSNYNTAIVVTKVTLQAG